MASQGAQAGKKRRADGPPSHRSIPKRRKPDTPVQHAKGEVNIANFVKAREFEINALEKNMRDMRKSLSSRAFQQVPRHMRRRTASHNVKKVPRRLRKRALREMKDDNTPTVNRRTRAISRKVRLRLETAKSLRILNKRSKTVRQKKKDAKAKNAAETDPDKKVEITRIPRIKKNMLAKPPTATTKYKRRQVNKTWLPTHLWHAKRAHMTRPTEPLWRLAMPLRPTEKSYRPTHRASSVRGCIAWDTSYMSTVSCQGTEHTLENLLKALGFRPERISGAKGKRWRQGTRFAEGNVHEIDGTKKLLGPALVIWIPPAALPDAASQADVPMTDGSSKSKKVKLDRRIFIRVHPSCLKDFWNELLKAAKAQKPHVLIEDLRFEIGSIRVTGPSATEALAAVLKPRHGSQAEDAATELWHSFAGLTNPGTLPERSVLPLEIVDPRLSHPPKKITPAQDSESVNRLNELICAWPLDQKTATVALASHKARWLAGAQLPSQKSINRRRTKAGPGKEIPVLEKDPSIPVLLLAHRSHGRDSTMQGSWEVSLPWPCVDAVWRSLMYYPLSTGNTPRFGGLRQTQQVAFEQLEPWFPADLPGTAAGKAWERTESERRFDAWVKRPPSRRMRWELIDLGLGRTGEIGRGWTCDWEYLFRDSGSDHTQGTVGTSSNGAQGKAMQGGDEDPSRRRNSSSPETTPEPDNKVDDAEADFYQLSASQAVKLLDPTASKGKSIPTLGDTPALATVRIRLLTKGSPAAGARIYRLPQDVHIASAKSGRPPADATAEILSPSLSSSAIAHTSTEPSNTPFNSNTTATSASSHAPPAAQRTAPSPPAFTSTAASRTSRTSSTPTTLRSKWLSLVPPAYHTHPSSARPTTSLPRLPPNPLTHPRLPDAHALHALNVLPRNATREVIDTYTPRPLTEAEHEERRKEEWMAQMARGDLLPRGMDGVDARWDVKRGLVECPDKGDLVGFVTSGGYNLVEGRGAAVGGLWVQRVREGWGKEDERGVGVGEQVMEEEVKGSGERKKKLEKDKERRVRERRLCVVRNAGESVGRLGWWEVCV